MKLYGRYLTIRNGQKYKAADDKIFVSIRSNTVHSNRKKGKRAGGRGKGGVREGRER
jgi:hypothetical protein